MEISVRKRRGKKFAICNFYSISQTCYVSGKNAVLALTRKFPDFLPRGGNLLRFWWEHPLSKEIFPAVKIGRAFFSVSSPDFAPKTAFRQNKVGRGGRGSKPPSLIFRHFTTAKRGQQLLIHIGALTPWPTPLSIRARPSPCDTLFGRQGQPNLNRILLSRLQVAVRSGK